MDEINREEEDSDEVGRRSDKAAYDLKPNQDSLNWKKKKIHLHYFSSIVF